MHRTSWCIGAALLGLGLAVGPAHAQSTPGVGDLVISEIAIAPQSSVPEWFEVVNVTDGSVDLDGCTLYEGNNFKDGTEPWEWADNDHTISQIVVIDPGERALLMRTSTPFPDDCVAYTDATATTCVAPTVYRYPTLGFNNTGAERLAISCPDGKAELVVDVIEYNWSVSDDDCPGEYSNNCTLNLCDDSLDATDNDDPENWTIAFDATPYFDANGASALGTPAADYTCPVPLDPCGPGDATITELMIAPPDGYKEWIELYGTPGKTECDLNECELRLGTSATPDDKADTIVTIDAGGTGLPLSDMQHLLLVKSVDCVAGHMDKKDFVCDIPADYTYGTIGLSNSEAKWVHLVCDGAVVDSAPSDWEPLDAYCPAGNCSAQLKPTQYNGTANDDLANWCLPERDELYLNPAEETINATPGTQGDCFSQAWPAAGEVVFTEVITSPQGGVKEWIELQNNAAGAVDLTFCELVKHRLDETGEVDPESIKTYLIGNDGRTLDGIEAGALQLLVYGDCLVDDETDTGEPVDDEEIRTDCPMGEFIYKTIQLTADVEEHLSLVCPDADFEDVVVDAIHFNADEMGIRDGHSLMVEADSLTAELNDDWDNWCEAAFSQKLDELSFPEDDKCNYGTPGEANECRVDQPEPLDPVCRCGTGAAPLAWWSAGLLGLVPLLRRRRR